MTKPQQLRDNLRQAISSSIQDLGMFATNMEVILEENYLEQLELPGKTKGDRLKNLICLPVEKGGLGTDIAFVDYLLKQHAKVHREFRKVYDTRSKGEKNEAGIEINLDPQNPTWEPSEQLIAETERLKEEEIAQGKTVKNAAKVAKEVEEAMKNSGQNESSPSSPKSKTNKPKKTDKIVSEVQESRDRASNRAIDAMPNLQKLVDAELISKTNATKLGKKIKDRENPTDKEKEIIAEQNRIDSELKELIAQYGDSNLTSLNKEQKKEFKAIALEIIGSDKGKLPKKRIELTTVEEVANCLISHYSFEERKQLSNLLLATDKIEDFPQPQLAA